MKKLLATVSATLLLAGSLLSSTALAAVEEKEVWKFSEGGTTDAATQTFSMGAVEYAIRSTPIDFTAEDLDITIDLKTTFANSDQMISVYFTKELPAAKPENGNGVCHTRFYLDNGKFGLNHSWLNGEALSMYAGGYVDFSADTTYTLRFRNVDGIIRLYINDQLTYDTAGDSHLGLPGVDKTEEALEQLELIPFRRAIEAGVPAIMMSHVLFPNIEPEQVPCTMSRRMVTGLLKQKLGFRGLILTDCMEMGAIRDYYGTPEGVVASIKAGVDLAEISSAFDLELAAAKAVNEAAERGEFDVEEIRASVEKILCYKKMLAAQAEPGLCNQPEDRRAAESMARQAISQISGTPFRADENTFFCGCADYRASGVANADGSAVTFPEYMANAFGAEGFVTGKDPDEEEIRAALRQAENCEKIILGTCNGHLFRGQLALAEALAATGKPMAVAALRNPYDLSRLPETVWKLAVYDYAIPAFRALEDIFRGGKATGVCPVKLL